MKTLTFYEDSAAHLGVVTNKGIVSVERLNRKHANGEQATPTTIHELIEGGSDAKKRLEDFVQIGLETNPDDILIPEDQITYGPVVTNPRKILCVGLNYINHAKESNMNIPKKPIIFNKFDNALCAHEEAIPLPTNAVEFDYEAELALVIGKEGKNIPADEAMEYVYGFTAANDFSARDLQFESPQWLIGKNLDKFCPLGPVLVSKDELENYDDLTIKTFVNGELRQNDTTKNMIFSCEEIVSYISQYMTLYPGDVILTGTPEGVILGYNDASQIWLKAGDEIVVEIEHIGTLRNKLVQAE